MLHLRHVNGKRGGIIIPMPVNLQGPDHSELPLEIEKQSGFKPDLTEEESEKEIPSISLTMLHLRHVNGKRGSIIILKNDPRKPNLSGPPFDKRMRDSDSEESEDQSSQSTPSSRSRAKHIRSTQRTVVVHTRKDIYANDFDKRFTFFSLYNQLLFENIINKNSSYVIVSVSDQTKFTCPGFHFPLNETIKGDDRLILTELDQTANEKNSNDLYRLKNVFGLYYAVKKDINDNWGTLIDNLFKLDWECASETRKALPISDPELDQLMFNMKHMDIQESKTIQHPPVIHNDKTLYCMQPGDVDSRYQLGSKDARIMNTFLLKHIYFSNGELKVSYLFHGLFSFDLLGPECPKYGSIDVENALTQLRERVREDDGTVSVVVLNDTARDSFYIPRRVPWTSSELSAEWISVSSSGTTFDCSGYNIESLPDIFNDDLHITKFECSNNKLRRLPDSVSRLFSLKSLNCTLNLLEQLPSLERLVNLTNIILSNNHLVFLPDLSNLTNLRVLDCSFNRLFQLPDSIENLKSLKHFQCNNNRFFILNPKINALTNLKIFDCSFNQLRVIPSISNLESLVKFNCSVNFLKNLPDGISTLSNLRKIECYNNKLMELPESIGFLVNLKKLDCSYNQLTSLPDSLRRRNEVEIIIKSNPLSPNYIAQWADELREEDSEEEFADELRESESEGVEGVGGFGGFGGIAPAVDESEDEETKSFQFF